MATRCGRENRNAKEFPRAMYVGYDVCKIRSGAGVEFEVVGVLEKGEEIIILEAVEGKHDLVWYRIDKESLPERLDVSSVKECYMCSDLLFED